MLSSVALFFRDKAAAWPEESAGQFCRLRHILTSRSIPNPRDWRIYEHTWLIPGFALERSFLVTSWRILAPFDELSYYQRPVYYLAAVDSATEMFHRSPHGESSCVPVFPLFLSLLVCTAFCSALALCATIPYCRASCDVGQPSCFPADSAFAQGKQGITTCVLSSTSGSFSISRSRLAQLTIRTYATAFREPVGCYGFTKSRMALASRFSPCPPHVYMNTSY